MPVTTNRLLGSSGGDQQLAPASGLMLAELERRLPSDKAASRVAFEVLGVIHSGEPTIDVDVVRRGRSIELIEANMRHDSQTSIRAREWRLSSTDTSDVEGTEWALYSPTPK